MNLLKNCGGNLKFSHFFQDSVEETTLITLLPLFTLYEIRF